MSPEHRKAQPEAGRPEKSGNVLREAFSFLRPLEKLDDPKTLLFKGFLILLFALFALFALWNAACNSGACDELGAHIPSGYLYWTSGTFTGGLHNFPLGQLIITLPVKLMGLSYELFSEQHLFLFRLPVVLMGLLLGIVVYRLARALFDSSTALAAVFLFVLSPNLLAHSSLATLDLPIAFFICLTFYLLWHYVKHPGLWTLSAFSFSLAFSLTVKIQALLLLPLAAVILAAYARTIAPRERRERLRFYLSWLLIPLISVLIINLVYLNNPFSSGSWLPPQFLEALKGKILHGSERGHFSYLMGDYSTKGWWYYFPLAILFKTPLPILILLGLGLARKPGKETLLFLIMPALAFLLLAMGSRMNIGLRHILIIYPFLMILAARGAAALFRLSWRALLLIGLLSLYIYESLAVFPHPFSYFNQLAGGPLGGHKQLIDSNYDWGLNDHYLRRYIKKKGKAYKINPEPFIPATGSILVNANALYGILRGGEKAYSWLKKKHVARNRVAYTWFEYEVPAKKSNRIEPPGLKELRGYLSGLHRDFGSVKAPHFHLALADALAQLADYGNAFELLRALLRRDPTFAPALGLGGELIVKWKLGILHFKGAQYLEGFKPMPPHRKPVVLSEKALHRGARNLRFQPPLAKVQFELGKYLDRQGRYREALQAMQLAGRLLPENMKISRYTAKLLERADKLNPQEYQPLFNLGSLAIQRGDYARARQYFQKALTLNPGKVEALLRLGVATFWLEGLKPALPIFNHARKLEPMNTKVYYNLAFIHDKSKQYRMVADSVKEVMRLQPGDSRAYVIYARFMVKAGQGREALHTLEGLAQSSPELKGPARGLMILEKAGVR